MRYSDVLTPCCLFLTTFARAECEILLLTEQLKLTEVNGQMVYVVSQTDVDAQLNETGCVSYSELLAANDATLANSEQALAAYDAIHSKLNTQLNNYRGLVDQTMELNQEYNRLSTQYQSQITRYETLANDFVQVSTDMDSLVDEYRDLAKQLAGDWRVGAGVGPDTYMVQGGYRYLNLFYLNVDEKSQFLLGGQLEF